MNTEPPFDIVRVPPGAKAPPGYVRVTRREAELLERGTQQERADFARARRARFDAAFAHAKRTRDPRRKHGTEPQTRGPDRASEFPT